jgi:hypothetical protein
MHIGRFTILDFAEAADPDVVYVETHTGARYLERPAELADYRGVFTRTYTQSRPISESSWDEASAPTR